jgi:phospholipid/cholesterol/gamma-HCH transport system substrate-binding protein
MYRTWRETLVGIFIIAGIVLFIVLYIWLSGRISLRNTYDVTVYFRDVEGLRVGDPVMVLGLEKGQVKSMAIDSVDVKTVLAVDQSIRLPVDTKISIRALSYVGADKYIRVTPGVDTLIATEFRGMSEALNLESIGSKIDSIVQVFKGLDVNAFSEVAADLSHNISKDVTRLVDMMKKPTSRLTDVLDRTDQTIAHVDSLTMLLQGSGTIGRLAKSDELYSELQETNDALQGLLVDIKENPGKYIKHLNIKVF